jgi:uncharacterized protein YkwD
MKRILMLVAAIFALAASSGFSTEAASPPAVEVQESKVPAPSPAVNPEPPVNPVTYQMFQTSNRLRGGVGLRQHRLCHLLTAAAQDHANYMAATGDFQHYSNGGPSGRALKYGHNGQVLENIAMGQPDVPSAFATWQGSGGHWASIVSNTTLAGHAAARGRNGQVYWCSVYSNEPVTTTKIVARPLFNSAVVRTTTTVPVANQAPGCCQAAPASASAECPCGCKRVGCGCRRASAQAAAVTTTVKTRHHYGRGRARSGCRCG